MTPHIYKSLERLIKENKFYTITSPEELESFENAFGNEWVMNNKSLQQKQYYIRHPKKTKQHLLIEAKSFYDYIEEEQKDELIDYIMSNCPAKRIDIERSEVVDVEGGAKAKIKNVDINVGTNWEKKKGNYFNFYNPNGVNRSQPRDYYLWIDNSIMRSISSLSEGSVLTQSYVNDLTFGLSINEAKTIGLDIRRHKKFSYTIHIEC